MSNSSTNKTMSTPLTAFEKISNMKSSSVVIPLHADTDLNIAMYTLRSQIYGIDNYNSNPLHLKISSPPCDNKLDSSCNLEISLYNYNKIDLSSISSSEKTNISCSKGNYISKTFSKEIRRSIITVYRLT